MKGLSFCEYMMKAWLAGEKTVTRRLVNPQPKFISCGVPYKTGKDDLPVPIHPRYQAGETVYIKETWYCDNPLTAQDIMSRGEGIYYKSTETHPEIFPKWKAGMFMPEWASRSKALIISVRLERVQDITSMDAMFEGVGYGFQLNKGFPDYLHIKNGICELTQDTAKMSYSTLWDSISGKKYPYSSNPLVWRYELKKISGTLPQNIDDIICDSCGQEISDVEDFIIGEDCTLHKKCVDDELIK